MRKFLFLLITLGITFHCFSQDYIVVGDTLKQGKVSKFVGSKVFFQEDARSAPVEYSLDQITEYKIKWTKYQAIIVDGNRAFYEIVASGNANLYNLGHRYAIARKGDNEASPFNKKNFRETLSSKLELNATKNEMNRVVYSRRIITHIVGSYNNNNLNIGRIPYPKLGIVAGYNTYKMSAVVNALPMIHGKPSAPFIGVFADIPVTPKSSALYFNGELNYSKFEGTLSQPGNGQRMDVKMNMKNAMAGFKFLLTGNKIGGYVKLNFVGSAFSFSSPTGLNYPYNNSSKRILVQPNSGVHFGYNSAVGVQYNLVKRINLHVEARYTSMLGELDQETKLKMSSTGFAFGLSF